MLLAIHLLSQGLLPSALHVDECLETNLLGFPITLDYLITSHALLISFELHFSLSLILLLKIAEVILKILLVVSILLSRFELRRILIVTLCAISRQPVFDQWVLHLQVNLVLQVFEKFL